MKNKLLIAAVLTMALAAPVAGFLGEGQMQQSVTSPLPFLHGYFAEDLAKSELASLERATEWLNSPPLSSEALRGKVVIVDFWTYTCINWLRTLPYVRAWHEKYSNHGLVVIGAHSPEFTFEKNLDNVRRATREFGVGFPVAVDSDHTIWRAFRNQYWPALYFIDAKGRLRHRQFGEGSYEQSEMIIRQLLAEAGATDIPSGPDAVQACGIEQAADWRNLKSPETYLGYDRAENFSSPGESIRNRPHTYSIPIELSLNEWALAGDWTVNGNAAVSNKPGSRIAYRFHARDLHLVMGPVTPGTSVRFRVLIDGQPARDAHGLDIDEKGYGTLSEQRLFQLIRQPGPIGDRQFEIEFLDAGAEAFAFTFG
jgi:thiol-disulfide isomerase/thioredoxin